MRHSWQPAILAGCFFAACGSNERLEEPRQVIAAQGEAQRSTPPFIFVASESDLSLFLGCYEIDLGPRFPRPVGWPSAFSLELTEKPGNLQAWRKATDSFSKPDALNWTFMDARRVLLSWKLPVEDLQDYFQFEFLFSHERYFVAPVRSRFPLESRSVRKVACK